MKQRGRVSAASMAVAVMDAAPGTPRLAATVLLTDAERDVWAALVNDMPAEHFSAKDVPNLEAYCRHVMYGRLLADRIQQFNPAWLDTDDGPKRYDKLLSMHEREVRAASSLATRLRITPQSLQHPETAGRRAGKPKTRKPWELPQAE